MYCWKNLIGIDRTCNPIPSDSGLYMQNIPFVNIKVADAGINEDYQNGVQLIQKCINNAYDILTAQFRSYVMQNMRYVSNVEAISVGNYEDLKKIISLEAGKYKGIRLRITLPAYFELTLHNIGLLLPSAITTNIKIFNLLTGKQIGADIPITTVSDEPTIKEINRSYLTEKRKLDIAILWDAGLSNAYQISPRIEIENSCHCGNVGNVTEISAISLPIASPIISANINSLNNTNGMFIKYSLNCSVDSYLCSQGKALAYPLLQKAGAELCREMQYSNRLSSIVTIQHNNIEKLRKEFELEYQLFVFGGSMTEIETGANGFPQSENRSKRKGWLQNLQVPNDFCFHCDDFVKNKVCIP